MTRVVYEISIFLENTDKMTKDEIISEADWMLEQYQRIDLMKELELAAVFNEWGEEI